LLTMINIIMQAEMDEKWKLFFPQILKRLPDDLYGILKIVVLIHTVVAADIFLQYFDWNKVKEKTVKDNYILFHMIANQPEIRIKKKLVNSIDAELFDYLFYV